MSWYMIILLIALYIVIWVITSVALSRRLEDASSGWVFVGFIWPFVIASIPNSRNRSNCQKVWI